MKLEIQQSWFNEFWRNIRIDMKFQIWIESEMHMEMEKGFLIQNPAIGPNARSSPVK
jgi:hypothetical protein